MKRRRSINSTDKILVLQTGGWIGDMVLLTPTLRALKSTFPQSKLALLVRAGVAGLMATHPHLDEIIVDTKGRKPGTLRPFRQIIRRVRQGNFDMALVLHPTSFRNALIPFLARIPIRIGSCVGGRGILLTNSHVHSLKLHEVYRYLQALKLIGISEPSDALEFWHSESDHRYARELLSLHSVDATRRVIGINLGTTWQTKLWTVEKFAEVITRLQKQIKCAIVLTGSSAEIELGKALERVVKEKVVNLAGKTTVMQLGGLIECCDLLLTCDSGPMHIAAAVGTPVVALFGPTSPLRHSPHGEGHYVFEMPVSCRPCYKKVCRRRDAPNLCMNEIEAAVVADRIISHVNSKD